MSKRFEGRTAFITGAGRGQGRAHALGFGREGAKLAVLDIGREVDDVAVPVGTAEDLEETVRLCEAEGAEVISGFVDVRDLDALTTFTEDVQDALGKIDIVCANAGVLGFGRLIDLTEDQWQTTIDINLTGVWKTIKAVVPGMAERKYGRVIITGSGGSFTGYPNLGHYVAAKHGVLGLTRVLALEHAGDGITVNCVCPGAVQTPLVDNAMTFGMHNPGDPTFEGAKESMTAMNAMPVPWLRPDEITSGVLFLADEANGHITGIDLKIDAGFMVK
jgi:SDR family mycofactocin-dependent oxidoreductase